MNIRNGLLALIFAVPVLPARADDPREVLTRALKALGLPDDYYEGLRAHYSEARDFLLDVLREAGFEVSMPRGAYYSMADVSTLMPQFGADDDFTFSRKLIDVTKVATVPGSSFYSDRAKGRTQVRFCFCKRWETLRAVADSMRHVGTPL